MSDRPEGVTHDMVQSYCPEDLFSSIEALNGGKIEWMGLMDAEISRQVNKYLLVRLKLPGTRTPIRLILLVGEVLKPCPNDLAMWEFFPDYFEADEVKARRMNRPLELPDFGGDE